jgi:SNW domain-containing protein 1
MYRLPAPLHKAAGDAQDEPSRIQQQQQQPSTALAVQLPQIPPYGQRKGWKPKSQLDFGDGGSYPECHCAQYPLELGRKKVSLLPPPSLPLTGLTNRLCPKQTAAGNTLALQVDGDGNVDYGVIGEWPTRADSPSFR